MKEHDHYGRPHVEDQLAGTMFGAPATPTFVQRWASLSESQRETQRTRWKEQLRPVVIRMAEIAAGDGITASDVISRGITDGILNGERAFLTDNPKVYAWVGAWLSALAKQGVLAPLMVPGYPIQVSRKSERKQSHANKNLVYVKRAA